MPLPSVGTAPANARIRRDSVGWLMQSAAISWYDVARPLRKTCSTLFIGE
ncbi:hypothetical protein M5J15_00665 [Serratia symbiotica]|nr:hypothetical protein [Serratia symbiotica]USS95826.1 hypothetical protein M5J15_00665 [Serratia symbiotica]